MANQKYIFFYKISTLNCVFSHNYVITIVMRTLQHYIYSCSHRHAVMLLSVRHVTEFFHKHPD